MTASALSTASQTPPGAAAQAAGVGKSQAAAGGALAGFEALLAALFPQGAPGAAAGAPGAAAATAAKTGDGKTAKAAGEAKAGAKDAAADDEAVAGATDKPGDDANPSDPAAALAASLAGAPTASTAPAEAKSGAETPAATATPGKTGGKSFQAAAPTDTQTPGAPQGEPLTAETGDAEPAVASSKSPTDPTAGAPSDKPAPAAKSAGGAAPPAWGRDKPAGQPAAPALQNAEAHAADAKATAPAASDASEPTPVTSDAAPEGAQTTASALEAPQAAAETAPKAKSDRAAKSERAKADPDDVPANLRPTEAVDRPVHARRAEAAARPASATVDAPGDDAKAADPEAAQPLKDTSSEATQTTTESRPVSSALAASAHTVQAVRGSPETIAALAAQIVKKLDGRSTRFDLELQPAGLGKVDVRLEIGPQGKITAALTCDNPHAASELKARSAELQRALEQAGFDLSGGLSFDVAGDGRQQGQAWQDQSRDAGSAFRGQAFRAALETAGEADAAGAGPLRLRRGVNAGLDLRI